MTTKQTQSPKETLIPSIMAHIGMAAMVLATVVSMAEIAEREGQRLVTTLTPQPAYVTADAPDNHAIEQSDTEFRRSAKEEIHHTAASYGAVRRVHSISGTL